MARTTNQFFAAAMMVFLCCGCQMLPFGAGDSAKLVDDQPQAPPQTFAIEYRPHGGKIKRVEFPLEPDMTVQDAVDQHKIGRYFRRESIDVMRPIPESREPLKMAIAWNGGKSRVAHSTNYALHPRDTILVTEDTTTVIDDMLESINPAKSGKKR
jgi:hypothetical protein